ncbi:Na(+)/H(+) antiporter NhaA [Desulfuromonas versatilis]|uniref:Na(+)/H(+) antiporter NhaA n=1 Tax=Desulfuromonas versatilis TaxID=2802975 RepID=A0ABM8HSE8_9BACT|nr:Na+/H+ antiporter NhaA [Desulfuromonas versatilis]BCR03571.1 Na(+)/H(+) antiporter NhaA [Desulfuromonas versatilis]
MLFKLSVLMQPFEDFFKRQASGGIVLMGATLLALLLANSPARDFYHHFWEIELTLGAAGFGLTQTLHHWINDGLMAVFFFVVGLEIKREFLAGELASARKAALPISAALGGMLVPALLYHLLNLQGPESHGWGIPMATDIAFALGIIALLGSRIPRSLAIFLTALAIVDDLGAVLVIALFYTGDISEGALALAGFLFLVLLAGNRMGIQSPNYYALVGFAMWVAMLKSGIHASIAGVLIGATIPVHPRHREKEFLSRAAQLITRLRSIEEHPGPFQKEEKLGTLLALEHICHDAMSPLQRMEHEMNAWVIFGVMPIFALANAGVSLDPAGLAASLSQPVTLGVALGLLVGKPLGIVLFSWLAVRLNLAELPNSASWLQMLGIGLLGGIGFTMSLFITNLAFHQADLITDAKVGIFAASLLAGLVGYGLLYRAAWPRRKKLP